MEFARTRDMVKGMTQKPTWGLLTLFSLTLFSCATQLGTPGSSDQTGESVLELEPEGWSFDDGAFVPTNVQASLRYSESIDDWDNDPCTIEGGSTTIICTLECDAADTSCQTIIAKPEVLNANTSYTLKVGKGEDKVRTNLGKNAIAERNFVTTDSSDTTSPKVVTNTPQDNATNVSLSTNQIEVTYDEALDTASLKCSSSSLVIGTVSYNKESKTVICPISNLSAGTKYNVTVTVRDLAGNEASKIVSFTTSTSATDTTKPTCTSTTPANGATDVDLTLSTISVVWSEAISSSSVSTSNISATGSLAQSFTSASCSTSSQCSYSMKSGTLTGNTTYSITISGVKDVAGNTNTDCQFSFTSKAAGDTTPPTVTNVTPTEGGQVSSSTVSLIYGWSEDMDSKSFTRSDVSCSPFQAFGTPNYSSAKKAVSYPLDTGATWACNTTYNCELIPDPNVGPKDTSGNVMAKSFKHSFQGPTCFEK